MLTIDKIYEAQKVLRSVARTTPLTPAPALGNTIYIKNENLQMTGSFKLRGAYNKLMHLSDEEKAHGVVACSAGNHAQGVALSATMMGIKSVICMPAGAPIAKVEATRGYGAEVVLVPGVYDDAAREAERLSRDEGYTFAHPFNDEYVMAGQGTIALEILDQLPEVEQIVVPIGGGGLIAGIAVAVKTLKPSCKVIGVQAAGAPSMYNAVKMGYIEELKSVATIADGIAVKKPGNLTYDCVTKYVDDVVTVSEDEIASAILALMESQKTVSEGAGATTVAAYLFRKVDTSLKTVCLVSGGNIDVTTLSRVINRGLIKSGRIAEITTKVVDKPGMLINLLQIIGATGANIKEIDHKREDVSSEVNSCVVSMVLETRNEAHVQEIISAIKTAGYTILH